MAQRADLLMGPFMRPRFLYATDRSPGRAVSSKLDLRAAHTHKGAHAHTRSTKSRTAAGNSWSNSSAQNLARDVCADVARPAAGGVEGHHAQGMSILTGQEIGDDRCQVGFGRVGLAVSASELTEVIQHEIDGAVTAVRKRRHCGALRHDTHALLRAGAAGVPLRGAAGFLSSATLRRSASMRLITRRGAASVCLRSCTAPACLAFRGASSAAS